MHVEALFSMVIPPGLALSLSLGATTYCVATPLHTNDHYVRVSALLPLESLSPAMDEIAPEYDVVVLGTGMSISSPTMVNGADSCQLGLTECVLSGYAQVNSTECSRD